MLCLEFNLENGINHLNEQMHKCKISRSRSTSVCVTADTTLLLKAHLIYNTDPLITFYHLAQFKAWQDSISFRSNLLNIKFAYIVKNK